LEDRTRYECASFGGVPETGSDGVRGELVRAGRGGRKQLDLGDVSGNVVLGLRGAAGMIVQAPEGGPYYQAPDALGTFDGLWHAEAPPCVTIRREDAAKLSDGAQVRVVLDASLTPGADAANVVGVMPGRIDGSPCIVGGHHD